jgi:signal peptidase II
MTSRTPAPAPSTAPPATWLWGPQSGPGLAVALATGVADQAHKWWMLAVEEIEGKGRYPSLPFLDIKFTRNTGVSFSMLDSSSYSWQLGLAVFAVAAALALWVWLARGPSNRLLAWSLGLIMGGAAGNAIDRVLFGGVTDYFLPHAFGIDWPNVFNIADVAIVAGVAGLLYESLIASRKDAANPL